MEARRKGEKGEKREKVVWKERRMEGGDEY